MTTAKKTTATPPAQSGEEPPRPALQRVGDIMQDVADMIGIGARVVREASDLAAQGGRKAIKKEVADAIKGRADKVAPRGARK